MRITNRQMVGNYLFNSNKNLEKLSEQYEKLESGRGFTKISQNVATGKKALKARTAVYRNEQYQNNAAAAAEQMTAAENGMNAINDQIQTVMSVVEKALNGPNTDPSSREIFIATLEETKEAVLGGLNTRHMDKYILGGTTGSVPFTVSDGGELLFNGSKVSEIVSQDGIYVDADGNEVQLSKDTYVDIGMGLALNGDSYDEKTVFKMSFSGIEWTGFGTSDIEYTDLDGNTYTETVSNNMFDILTEMQSALEDNDTDRLGALNDLLNDQYDNLLTGIAKLGTKANYLESIKTKLKDESASLAVVQQDLEGITDAEEITVMNEYNYAWLLTLKFGSEIIPQSLMDYLR